MIVAYNNASEFFWLPVYSLNDKAHGSPAFKLVTVIQTIVYCCTAYVTTRTCFIFTRFKLFHENITILMAWFIAQWFEAILAKLVILLYQSGTIPVGNEPDRAYFSWWTEDVSEMVVVSSKQDVAPLCIACFFMWHYIASVIIAPVVVGLERLCATCYLRDYEHVKRRHIPFCLILATNLITIAYAHFILHNQIPFLAACAQCVVNASFVLFGYFIGWKVNAFLKHRMENGLVSTDYSLARKFQVEENLRYLLLARKLVFVVVIYLSISFVILMCLVFVAIHEYDAALVVVLDNTILSAALVVSVTILYCSPIWRDAFITGMPFIRRIGGRPRIPQFKWRAAHVSESEVYFIQLQKAWV